MNKEQLMQAIEQREADVAHYQINIDNYSVMIDMLPNSWPAHLEAYKSSQPVDLFNALPFEDLELISDLQYKEHLQKLLLTERLEQRKSTFVLKALKSKLV